MIYIYIYIMIYIMIHIYIYLGVSYRFIPFAIGICSLWFGSSFWLAARNGDIQIISDQSTGMTPRCSAWKGLRGIVEDEPPDTAPSESWCFAAWGSESGRRVNSSIVQWYGLFIFKRSAIFWGGISFFPFWGFLLDFCFFASLLFCFSNFCSSASLLFCFFAVLLICFFASLLSPYFCFPSLNNP